MTGDAGGDHPGAPARLAVRDLGVAYTGRVALRSVTVEVAAGQIVGVIGPNGGGKSSLLKAVVGLVPVTGGSVTIDGRPAAAARSRVAYLPQRSAVDWDYPAQVREVVAMGRSVHRRPLRRATATDRAKVDEALARLRLTSLARRRIGDLSGGQQQRVLLARALAQEAGLLLLDEPFVGVDALTEELLVEQFREAARAGAAVVVVHHDLAAAPGTYDRLLLLAGRTVAYGAPEEVLTAQPLAAAYGGVPAALARSWDAVR